MNCTTYTYLYIDWTMVLDCYIIMYKFWIADIHLGLLNGLGCDLQTSLSIVSIMIDDLCILSLSLGEWTINTIQWLNIGYK